MHGVASPPLTRTTAHTRVSDIEFKFTQLRDLRLAILISHFISASDLFVYICDTID